MCDQQHCHSKLNRGIHLQVVVAVVVAAVVVAVVEEEESVSV